MQAGVELKDEVFHHSGKRLHWVPLTGILTMKAEVVCLCLSGVFVFKFDISLKSRPKKSPLQFFSVTLLPKSEMENNKFPTISQCKKTIHQVAEVVYICDSRDQLSVHLQCLHSKCVHCKNAYSFSGHFVPCTQGTCTLQPFSQ